MSITEMLTVLLPVLLGVLVFVFIILFRKPTLTHHGTPSQTPPRSLQPGSWSVHLTSPGNNKIEAIKLIRHYTNLSLAESKKLIDRTPTRLIHDISLDSAKEIQNAFEAIGATVHLQNAPEQPQLDNLSPSNDGTTASLILLSPGPHQINVIKEIRQLTGLGLFEAKQIIDHTPATIKSGLPPLEADRLKAKLEGEGARVEVRIE